MYSWRPGAITCLYDHLVANDVFNYKAANPDVVVTVRFQRPLNWHQDLASSAQELGRYVATKWAELQPLDPYVYFAHHVNMHYANGDPNPANQQRYNSPEFYQKYANWVRLTADVIKNAAPDIKLVTPPFAFGFNEDGSPDMAGNPRNGWAGYDYLQDTVRDYFDSILTFHAYWGYPTGGSVPDWLYEPRLSSWYAFRWRRVLKLFETRYNLNARVIVDEAASFGPADPDFTDQLIYYAEQCLSDERVICLTYFLWSDPANDPLYNLNAWVEGVPELARHLNRLKEMADVAITSELEQVGKPGDLSGPAETMTDEAGEAADNLTGLDDAGGVVLRQVAAAPVEMVPDEVQEMGEDAPGVAISRSGPVAGDRPIRVLFEDGSVETMPLEEYLRAVVPGEMPALWPMEALKAQAIASRTYAQYAIEHPRFPNADICTTTRCQHYAPDKIHPRSDQAIQETRGLIVLYEGKTINALFSAHCGGHTRNNEEVWSGRPLPYLRGVPCPAQGERHGHGVGFCQHGARIMASEGRQYNEIIEHYYQGGVLGPIPEG
jgi:hypothetical protein